VKIGPGDIPLLYTGRWKRRAAAGPWASPVAGYYPDTIPWMHERLPAFIGHDFNIDWNPRPGWEGMRNPIHVAVLIWMGINIVECLDLEELVTTARRLNRYESVITFAPLPVEGGTRIAGQSSGDFLTRLPDKVERLAGFRIEAGCRVRRVDMLPAGHEGAVGAKCRDGRC